MTTLRVHLRWDGGIYIERTPGESGFATEVLLRRELARVQAEGGLVVWSTEHPDRTPPEWVVNTWRLITSYQLPTTRADTAPGAFAHDDSARAPRTFLAAAYRGDVVWVDELIRRGLPVDEPDEDGQTALMYAANAGHADVVRRLVAAGANVRELDHQGNSALMFAAQHGHSAAVHALLAAGSDPTTRGRHGLTAADFARQNGHTEVAKTLSAS